MPDLDCPSTEDLKAFVLGELAETRSQLLLQHLETCPRCEALTQQLDQLDDPLIQAIRQGEPPTLGRGVNRPGDTVDDLPPPSTGSLRRSGPPHLPESGLGEEVERLPERVADYTILAELGRGGMGVVYKARQARLNRVVALKMILHGGHADVAALARFRVEAQAIARLQHPNIVQVYEVGDDEGRPFFSLEYCGGGSLGHKLEGTPLPPLEAAQLVQTLARAIQAAHDKNVIHRDLKPANVLLTDDGTPKVSDFGLAKQLDHQGQTGAGTILGTPSYMAPEQAGGGALDSPMSSGPVGPACDIYALGALLYECLTGRPPFRAATPLDTVLQVVSLDPVPPTRLNAGVPRDLETICLKCLRKVAHHRYASATALADDLGAFLHGEPIQARPVSRLERLLKWARKRPAAAALLALLLALATTAIAAGFCYQQLRIAHAEEKARLEVRRTSVANDVLAALEEIDRRRHTVRDRLASSIPASELLSDLDGWKAALDHAHAAWTRADRLAASNSDLVAPELLVRVHDLDQQLKADQEDRDLANELDDIRLEAVAMVQNRIDKSRAEARYGQVFARLGLNPNTVEPASLAASIRTRTTCFVLVAGLDHWASLTRDTKTLLPRLLETSRRADPHPWRDRIRDPEHWRSRASLEKVAAEVRYAEHSPQVLSVMAIRLGATRGDPTAFLNAAVRHYPKDFWLHFLLGQHATDQAARVGCFRCCLCIRPHNAIAHNQLGLALLEQKDREGALFHFNKAIEHDPNFAGAYLNAGNALRDQQDLDGAIVHFRKALEIDPTYAGVHHNLAGVLHQRKDLKGALLHFRKAVELAPKEAKPLVGLAGVLRDSHDLKGAIAHYKKALELDDRSAGTHNNLALVLRVSKDLDGAIVHYKKALELDPSLAATHSNLGNALRSKKDLEGAIVHHRKAVELGPTVAGFHYNLGNALRDGQDLKGAIVHFKTAVQLDPSFAQAHNGLAHALYASKDVSGAVVHFKKVAEINPKDVKVHVNLGQLLADQDLDAAIFHYRTAVKLDPRDAVAQRLLSKALHRQKE